MYPDLVVLLRERHGSAIFSEDGSLVDDQVAALLAGRTIATAESCTGGMLCARLTDRAGSSAYVAGGTVVLRQLREGRSARRARGPDRRPRCGVRAGGRSHGRRCTASLRRRRRRRDHRDRGARRRHRAQTRGHGVLLRAPPDGHGLTRTVRLPGDRTDVRERSTTVAMHLLRRALQDG